MLFKVIGGAVFFAGLLSIVFLPHISHYQPERLAKSGIIVGILLMVIGIFLMII